MADNTSSILDIAIIGAAHPHVEYVLSEIAARTDVRIAAVADHDAARLAELELRTQAPGYADPIALLEAHNVEAVGIFTEFGLRAPIVAELLRRNIFAIVDKPMAVTLPQLAPVILLGVTLRLLDAVKLFDVIFMLTGGGPGSSTYTTSFYLYQIGFQQFHLSMATAGSWMFLILLSAVIIALVRRLLKAETA